MAVHPQPRQCYSPSLSSYPGCRPRHSLSNFRNWRLGIQSPGKKVGRVQLARFSASAGLGVAKYKRLSIAMSAYVSIQPGGNEGGLEVQSDAVEEVFRRLQKKSRVSRGTVGLFVRNITAPMAAGLDLPCSRCRRCGRGPGRSGRSAPDQAQGCCPKCRRRDAAGCRGLRKVRYPAEVRETR